MKEQDFKLTTTDQLSVHKTYKKCDKVLRKLLNDLGFKVQDWGKAEIAALHHYPIPKEFELRK